MSGIVSSVGLASGLPIQDIIDQLIAVQSRPYLLTLQRIEAIQQKRASYTTLNAQLLALKNAVTQFDRLGFFRRSQATSSNPTVLATSDEEVGLTVARDVDAITETIQTFVITHNSVIDSIDELTFFDAEALQSGPLRGEGTINTVRSRLRSVIIARIPTDDATVSRLSSIGISFGGGGKLEFDEARFREAFGEDPEAVEELFTLSDTKQELDSSGNPVINPNTGEPVEKFVGLGFGFRIDEVLDALTRTFDGLLASKDNSLRSQEDLLSDQAEFLLTLLDGKRARLELRFARLEQSLDALTRQQSVLSVLAASAASFR